MIRNETHASRVHHNSQEYEMRSVINLMRWFGFWPLLFIASCNCLTTGSPFPISTGSDLIEPVQVRSLKADAIELVDGRRVAIPHIKSIPTGDALVATATSQGVEIKPNGDVIGLLWMKSTCISDGTSRRRLRVNLTHLITAIDPSQFTPEFSPADLLDDLRLKAPSDNPTHFYFGSMLALQHWKELIESRLPTQAVREEENSEDFLAAVTQRTLMTEAANNIQLLMAVIALLAAVCIRSRVIGWVFLPACGVVSFLFADSLLTQWYDGLFTTAVTRADSELRSQFDGGMFVAQFMLLMKAAAATGLAGVVRYAVRRSLSRAEEHPTSAASGDLRNPTDASGDQRL